MNKREIACFITLTAISILHIIRVSYQFRNSEMDDKVRYAFKRAIMVDVPISFVVSDEAVQLAYSDRFPFRHLE